MTNHMVNPSRTSMQQELGKEVRALIDDNGDLYAWRSMDTTHFDFAAEFNLKSQAWLYIDPYTAVVRISTYSHSGQDYEAVKKHVRELPRLKFYTVEPEEEAVAA